MGHFKDNLWCSGPKKSEIFWNNSRKVQYVFAGDACIFPFAINSPRRSLLNCSSVPIT